MTNEEVRSRHNKLVEEIRVDIKRMQRIKNAAPQMLEALKYVYFEDERNIDWGIVQAAIVAAEGENSN